MKITAQTMQNYVAVLSVGQIKKMLKIIKKNRCNTCFIHGHVISVVENEHLISFKTVDTIASAEETL